MWKGGRHPSEVSASSTTQGPGGSAASVYPVNAPTYPGYPPPTTTTTTDGYHAHAHPPPQGYGGYPPPLQVAHGQYAAANHPPQIDYARHVTTARQNHFYGHTAQSTSQQASSTGQDEAEDDEEEEDDEDEEEDDDDQDMPKRSFTADSSAGLGQRGDAAEDMEADDDDDDEDDEDDEDEEDAPAAEATADDDDEDDEDDDDDMSNDETEGAALVPRGKPEALSARLAAARIEASRDDLDEEDDDAQDGEEPLAEAVEDDEDEDEETAEPVVVEAAPVAVRKSPAKSKSSSSAKKKKAPPQPVVGRRELLLGEAAPPITEAEYENVEALMIRFCRVPLLSEFSRPVTLLHPELASAYSKIVSHPVDLGHVCRGIRRRQYKNTRDIRLDMWRVFANCVKFHSHPNNKEAVPSFVSIALHLREHFNTLWQEYMLPSEIPQGASEVVKAAFAKREADRKKRLANAGVFMLGQTFINRASAELKRFYVSGGCVDKLDVETVFETGLKPNEDRDLDKVVQNFVDFVKHIKKSKGDGDYELDSFYKDLMNCYKEVLQDKPALRNRVALRVNRYFWKRCMHLHEANSRGVTQSSIWGNIATTIWARESSKKPFWPALCLGILPPEEQREGWHGAVTERNESRLPEKLRAQLMAAKKKCEQAQKRQNLSYFLVEFLGTHEFIWVRETDIVEKFDPSDDPNKKAGTVSKKKRSSRSGASNVVGSKTYATALEECVWANEEYDSVLNEAFDYVSENSDQEEDEEEMNYSYAVLAQSDDEADDEDSHGYYYDETSMSMSDVDEANWLLTHDGQLDTSAEGRKNAKKRAQALKKKATEKDKEPPPTKKKTPTKKDSKAKEREEKKEQRDLEKRRKRRQREREKVLRNEARKQQKRRRTSGPEDSDDDERVLAKDKRARASAIVTAYLTRMANAGDYKSLALGGVMTLPAAMVDSTGLLGMTLAFRAVAGELTMPDDGEDQTGKSKPWTLIDTEKPNSAKERAENLEKKVRLLEREIDTVRANSERRRRLAEEAIRQRESTLKTIEVNDIAARQNHYKKRKKSLPRDLSPEKEDPAATANLNEDSGEKEATETTDG